MSVAYAEPAGDDALKPLTAADLERDVLKKPPGWFGRDRNRKRLYDKGFPHPFERGLWSRSAVVSWLSGAGSNPDGLQPAQARKAAQKHRRRQRPNAYAEVAEVR